MGKGTCNEPSPAAGVRRFTVSKESLHTRTKGLAWCPLCSWGYAGAAALPGAAREASPRPVSSQEPVSVPDTLVTCDHVGLVTCDHVGLRFLDVKVKVCLKYKPERRRAVCSEGRILRSTEAVSSLLPGLVSETVVPLASVAQTLSCRPGLGKRAEPHPPLASRLISSVISWNDSGEEEKKRFMCWGCFLPGLPSNVKQASKCALVTFYCLF